MSILSNIYIYIINKNNKTKLNYLRKLGAKIGNKTRLNCKVQAFGTEPFLIEVGEDCLFSDNVHFITHDGGVKVLNSLDYFSGKRMDKLGKIKVGNNVYIGMGAYIMPNVSIGDNVIIGSNSIITHSIPSNVVVAGIPGRVICDIEEYYKKNINCFYPTAAMNSKEKEQFIKNKL